MAAYLQISLLACAGTLLVGLAVGPGPRSDLHATTTCVLADTDDDFLPNDVEWAVMTSSTNPDTDGDQVPDFVEVVQRGTPRLPNWPLSLDHEMRVVVSAPATGAADQTAWLHVLVRFVEATVPVEGFAVWFESPWLSGVRIPLEGFFLAAPTIESRTTAVDGTWLRVSAPLVSMSLLHALLPCSIQCEGTVQGRYLRTGVNMFEVQGAVTTIVPFGGSSFALQTIAPPTSATGQSNRVCVLDLTEVGSGPGGTVFEVTHAECQDCNDLECGSGCVGSVGWLLTIPGGTAVLSGN